MSSVALEYRRDRLRSLRVVSRQQGVDHGHRKLRNIGRSDEAGILDPGIVVPKNSCHPRSDRCLHVGRSGRDFLYVDFHAATCLRER